MALTAMERSLCNQLQQKFNSLKAPLDNSKNQFKNLQSQFKEGLRSINFSPQQDVTDAVTSLQSQMNNHLPGNQVNDMEKLRDFISQCEFLSGANPVGALLGGIIGIYDRLDTLIDSLAASVPEMGLGKLADQINKLLSGLSAPGGNNLSNLFKDSDKLLSCVNALCGEAEYTSWLSTSTTTLDNLYTDYNVVSDPLDSNYGNFDYDTAYSDVGLTSGQKTNMTIAISGITTVRNSMNSAVESAVSSAKSLIGTGGFF
ncbi:MAG: hypothetical protein ACFFG0_01615 [Candidatus Thorarchaeota archaeon]